MFKQGRYEFKWLQHVSEVEQSEWDALAVPLATPFFEWTWLNDMEKSGSAIAQTGWMPCHLIARCDGQLVAAAPLYLKGHSYGEFVFDQQFAELADRLGIGYYPKLLGMSPFTPAEGYRFLIDPSENEAEMTAQMVQQIDRFCNRNGIRAVIFSTLIRSGDRRSSNAALANGSIIILSGETTALMILMTISSCLTPTSVAILNANVKP